MKLKLSDLKSDVETKKNDWFLCNRTSTNRYIDNKPCEESFEIPIKNPINPDLPTFAITIKTLKDLMDFLDKYGMCVIGKTCNGYNYIEIYDYYRE